MSRPYTAVLINWHGNETQIVTIELPLETKRSDAAHVVEQQYPGTCLVALVPGDHSGHSTSYVLKYAGAGVSRPGRQSPMQQLDLFDTEYTYDGQED